MKTNFKNIITALTLVLLSLGCQKKHVKPECMTLSDTLYLPIENLAFTSNGEEWEASLLSFIQTVPLHVKNTNTGIKLSQMFKHGLLEGPAHICLKSGKNSYYYHFYLKNRDQSRQHLHDYRSPKSLLPDYNLSQQKILLATDEWRNLTNVSPAKELFRETALDIPPVSGIYRAQKEVPLSSYYVHAGLCIHIPLRANANKRPDEYKITAGPLLDQHKNLINDGTLLTFIYNDGLYSHLTETSVFNGFAFAILQLEKDKEYKLFAKIDKISSDTIIIKLTP